MKRYKYVVLLAIICLLTVSCGTRKISIVGLPGTVIYNDCNKTLGTIDQYGVLETTNYAIGMNAFLKAQLPSGKCIPFAIEYKRGTRRQDIAIFASGLGFLPWAIPSMYHLSNNEGEYDYKIRRLQYINCGSEDCSSGLSIIYNDCGINFTTPHFKEYVPEEEPVVEKNTQAPVSNVKKTLKNLSNQTVGDYTCTGTLKQDGSEIENYETIIVRIQRVSDNVVSVNVIESNEEAFFNEAEQYGVSKQMDGSFLLTHKTVDNATIRITPSKRII